MTKRSPERRMLAKRRSPPRKDPLFRLFEAELGLQELMDVLALSGELRALSLLDLLSDPAYSRHTLSALCARIGLTFIGLLDIYRRVQLNIGIMLMANHLSAGLKKGTILSEIEGDRL
jgi:hypothetical protein